MEFSDLRLNRVILELRYNEGFLYWDRCGATLKEILKRFPEWKWERTSTELTRLINTKRNMELTFNINNILFIQNEVENLNQFKISIGEIAPLIVEKLEIEKFRRVGNRFLYVFPSGNVEQGKKIIQKSRAVEIPQEKLVIFGEKALKTSFVVEIENESLHHRIELTTIWRTNGAENIKLNEEFYPKYGLRVDIDIATLNEVGASTFNCSDFIQRNKQFLENNLIKFVQG